ncbi:hypothetical protein [Actinoplanes regularis]|uniref:Uncharacterized protein n=1 Tax=Actinoplanes regularis TaxID=52697 RepID=A0A238Y6E6_9ACTN|nr:hypothetical protein [Actinoplanes regularis]SNR66590.1 hypothetical protein SAMN06264365_104296 [Actinoplanes regularis]
MATSRVVADSLPFRWDLVTPDQLGSLLDDSVAPDLSFLDDLVACTGKVLARSGDGDLIFVGRSLDSMFDLLGGVLAGSARAQRLHRLPLSFQRPAIGCDPRYRRFRRRPLTSEEVAQGRRFLAAVGLAPHALARRDRPAVLVDVVDGGGTFTELFTLVRDWIDEEREPWPVIRRKLRFVGVTSRCKTSPNTYRWQQHAAWTQTLPAAAVANVSLERWVWSYFGDHQVKLTRSFRPDRWTAEAEGPDRDERTRQALTEAAALVAYGRSRAGRQAVARAVGRDPALSHPWLRTLVTNLATG